MNRIELENRLLAFASKTNKIAQIVGNKKSVKHLETQLNRSSSSCALNYAEAQGAESRKDFVHKLRIVLKELRETQVCLKLIGMIEKELEPETNAELVDECGELVAIFVSSIKTIDKSATWNSTSKAS
ncbi:MAG: four helix bundle protein [Bacteroidetes bacterium]|nr:four helix bundle protein [Bacteroidota bacterium]